MKVKFIVWGGQEEEDRVFDRMKGNVTYRLEE
jgi:hypothetical protein